MTADPAGNGLLLGGRPADLDHIAALMVRLAGASAPPSSAPMGLAGASRPAPPSSGNTPLESAAVPGNETARLSSFGLSEGVDPSLLSLDLAPLRKTGRDLPSTQAPAPARAASRMDEAGAPSRALPHGMPVAVPVAASVPAAGALPPVEGLAGTAVAPPPGAGPPGGLGHPHGPPSAAPAAGGGYYFVPQENAAPLAAGRGPMIRDDFPILRQRVNGHRLVWLDSAATTQKPAVVIDTEAEFYRRDNSNVHRGAHTLARRATDAYEGARRKVQAFLGAAAPEEIVFVRGATEGINLIAQSLGGQIVGEGDEVVVTHLEHHSNIVPWQMLCERRKAVLRVAPVDDRGDVQLDAYAGLLGPRTRIVALAQVSNVLGTLVPVAAMAAMAHERGAVVVVDGAQSAAHLPVDVVCLGADFFVFSGHKLYAPTGIGAVYGRKALLEAMPPWQGGGSMIELVSFEKTTYARPPAKFEAGTGHFAGAVGLGAAIDYLEAHGREAVAAHEQALIRYATDALMTVPGLRLLGAPTVRVGALSFAMAGHAPADVAAGLDRRGIAVRAGHHCAQPILRRFGLAELVRASLGIYSADDDIDALVAALRELAARGPR